jgi:flagellar biosynthetic protein FliR
MTISETLSGIVLVGIRLGGLFVFAPYFSSAAIAPRLKVILLFAMTLALGPIVVGQSRAHVDIGVASVAREMAISLIFGLVLSLVMELANTAGQIAGLQMSFTLVNLLDPSSNIETSLFSSLFQMFTTTLVASTGADRAMISGLLRTYEAVPLAGSVLDTRSLVMFFPMAGGIILAAFQLAAPLIAATVLVEVSIAFLSRLSPQLPVMALTVPAKTLMGYVVLMVSLSAWAVFVERRFSWLLDCAQASVTRIFAG